MSAYDDEIGTPEDRAYFDEYHPGQPRYLCTRCIGDGRLCLEADRVTHNQYHDDMDAGRPSRFTEDYDYCNWHFYSYYD